MGACMAVDPNKVQFLGAATKGVIDGLLLASMTLSTFDRRGEIEALDPAQYHPLSLYLDLVEFLHKKFGPVMMRKLGQHVGQAVVNESLPATIPSVTAALLAIDAAHEHFCKPKVGSFAIAESQHGFVKIHYDAPYFCILQEGLFNAIANRFGGRGVRVEHPLCRLEGPQSHCIFNIRWMDGP